MSELLANILLAKGYEISTIRHIKYNAATYRLEVVCSVRGVDVRARFVKHGGLTSSAYIRVGLGALAPFLAAVFAAFPPGAFERLELDPLISYRRRTTPAVETAGAPKNPPQNKKGFGARRYCPYHPHWREERR